MRSKVDILRIILNDPENYVVNQSKKLTIFIENKIMCYIFSGFNFPDKIYI